MTTVIEDKDSGDNSAAPAARASGVAVRWVRKIAQVALLVGFLAGVVVVSGSLVSGSWTATPVLSGSMRPGLPVGGVAIAQRVPVSSLAVRDVIIFRRPDDPSEQMVHRIVRLTHAPSGQIRINTQGDANQARDPWTMTIAQSHVYRVRWSVPLIGYAAVAYRNDQGLILMGVGTLCLLVAVGALKGWRNERLTNAKVPRHASGS